MSNAAQENSKELLFPTTVPQAYDMLQNIEKELKKLQKRKDGLKQFLSQSIPERGSMVDGVKNVSFDRTNTGWKSAYYDVIEQFVPKTRHAEAKEVYKEHQSVSETLKFEMEED